MPRSFAYPSKRITCLHADKDRNQNKHVPYSYPVAYALKGSSMSNCDLHFMVNKLRNELKKKEHTCTM